MNKQQKMQVVLIAVIAFIVGFVLSARLPGKFNPIKSKADEVDARLATIALCVNYASSYEQIYRSGGDKQSLNQLSQLWEDAGCQNMSTLGNRSLVDYVSRFIQ